MAEPRRIPGLGVAVVGMFILLPLIGVGWWLNRPKPDLAANGPRLGELDVVCIGRVDGLTPAAGLEPAMPGQVQEVFVADGQSVRKGDQLLKLNDESLKLRAEEANEAVAAAQIELDAAELDLKLHPLRLNSQKIALEGANDRVTLARQLLKERETAQQFGTVTAIELLGARAEIKQAEQLVKLEEGRLEELRAAKPELRTRAATSRKTMATIAQKQAEKALRDCLLLAPADGTVLRVQTSIGESVMPGSLQPPIVFRSNGPLVVRAELEQEFLGRVEPGMKATLRDDARPDSPTWEGTVLHMGNWVARKRSVLLDPGEVNDVRTVECVITLDKAPEGLLVGQRMRVRLGHPD